MQHLENMLHLGLTVMGECSLYKTTRLPGEKVLRSRIDPTKFMPWWFLGAVFSEVTKTFLSQGEAPDNVSENALTVIEMFVVLIYDRTNEFCRVNSATQQLFSWKSCCLESILPSQSALVQPILGAAYQGMKYLGAGNTVGPKAPKSCKVKLEKKHVLIWKTFLDKSGMNYEFIHCKCRKACKCYNCYCYKDSLNCAHSCFWMWNTQFSRVKR